jgi:hypothetical protein
MVGTNRNAPSNSDDLIDSRDVIKRIEELEGFRDDLQQAIDDAKNRLADYDNDDEIGEDDVREAEAALSQARAELDAWLQDDEVDELRILQELADEGESSPDWTHGETLIRESYFEEYARELAADIGDIGSNARWPNNHIDWEAATAELLNDYFEVDFDGVTYYIRG